MFKIENPYNGKIIGEFEYTSSADAMKAVAELKAGRKKAQERTPKERYQILMNLVDLLEKNKEKMAQQITAEMGKTITDSRIEIERSKETFLCSAEEAKRVTGEALNSDSFGPKREKMGIVVRKPLGTILCITPFNFPINLAAHKIGPAFATGNTIFFKPGPQNYLSSKMLTDLCHEAGMTSGDIQIHCPNIPVMGELTRHKDINCVSFTGGVAAAKAITENAGIKKLLFELGGNDPLIVMPDADIDKAVTTAVNQRFQTAGQRCTASKRLFIHEAVYEEFKTKLVSESKKLIIGDPTKDDTVVGPVVHTAAADIVKARIEEAIKDGANCLLGNEREGNIIHPTILENVSTKSELICDETFGPVIPLLKFSNLDEAIKIINSTDFGLQSGVFTNDLTVIKKLFNELEVGALAVNDGPGFRAEHFPFGGVKYSGLGREGVKYAIEEMTYQKTLIL